MSTITYIGAGAAVTANNASLNPAAHASTAVGDLVVITASIQNSGTGTVNTPTGWTAITTYGNMSVLGRFWQTGDAMPTITFTGGAAGADTIARAFTFRGVSKEALTTLTNSATLLNASATNIAYPAMTVGKDRNLILAFVWRQDDATAYTTPAGFTQIGLTSTTTGNDASQATYYSIQTTATNISSGTITVTGGAASISRVILLALKPAASITVTSQDQYPPRNVVSVTDLTIGDSVSIYRSVAGVRTLVQGASASAVTDPSYVRIDATLPFGVPVSYVAVVNGIEYTTSSVTYDLPGGKVAISDAITGLSAEVVIGAWPDRVYDRQATTFRAGGRNVVVSGDFGGFEADIELYTDTWSSAENLREVLANATQGIVQIRQPGTSEITGLPYEGVDCFVAVTGYRERRYSQDGSDPIRLHVLHVVEVDGWASTLQALGFTYDDLTTVYSGLTYANLASDYSTYLALSQADLS